MRPNDSLEIGYVARAHGLAGELGVKTFDPASEALFQVKKVLLQPKEGPPQTFRVKSVRDNGKEVLVKLEGIHERAHAEGCVGSKVRVFRAELPPLEEGEFFLGDLLGLEAFDVDGQRVGKVTEVQAFGPVPNLVISRDEQEEWILPFVEPFVGEVDLEKGRLTVQPAEFLE